MKVENNTEFEIVDDLTVVTENGWSVYFYFHAELFDVFIGNKKVVNANPVNLLSKGYSIPSGVDVLTLKKQKNGKVKLTEESTKSDEVIY